MEKLEDTPGPGSYEPQKDKVLPRAFEATMEGEAVRHGYISKGVGELPGPGQYIEENSDPKLM